MLEKKVAEIINGFLELSVYGNIISKRMDPFGTMDFFAKSHR